MLSWVLQKDTEEELKGFSGGEGGGGNGVRGGSPEQVFLLPAPALGELSVSACPASAPQQFRSQVFIPEKCSHSSVRGTWMRLIAKALCWERRKVNGVDMPPSSHAKETDAHRVTWLDLKI